MYVVLPSLFLLVSPFGIYKYDKAVKNYFHVMYGYTSDVNFSKGKQKVI